MHVVKVKNRRLVMAFGMVAILAVGCGPRLWVHIVDDLPPNVAKGYVEFYPVYSSALYRINSPSRVDPYGIGKISQQVVDIYELVGPDTVLLGLVWLGIQGSQTRLKVARPPGNYYYLLKTRLLTKVKEFSPARTELGIHIEKGMLVRAKVIFKETDVEVTWENWLHSKGTEKITYTLEVLLEPPIHSEEAH